MTGSYLGESRAMHAMHLIRVRVTIVLVLHYASLSCPKAALAAHGIVSDLKYSHSIAACAILLSHVMTSQHEQVNSTPDRELTPSSSKIDLRSNLSAIFLRPTPHNGPTESSPLLPGSSHGTPARTWTMDMDESRQSIDGEEPGDGKQGDEALTLPGGEVDTREFSSRQLWFMAEWARWGSEKEAEYVLCGGQED